MIKCTEELESDGPTFSFRILYNSENLTPGKVTIRKSDRYTIVEAYNNITKSYEKVDR